MINFNNHKPEVLSEKSYLKSSITLFKHKKLLKTDYFRKITTHLSRYKCLKKSLSAFSSSHH